MAWCSTAAADGRPPAAVLRAGFPWVTVAVILVLIGVFIAEITMTPDQHDDHVSGLTLIAFGGFSRQLVLGGEVQRVFMSSLLHIDAEHLAGSCLILAMTGWYLERIVGHAWLGCVLALGVIGGGVSSMLLTPDRLSAGASDAIMAVVAAAFVISFRRPPTRQRLTMHVLLLVVALLTLLPAVVTPDDPDINNGAHFGGWVTGLAIGWLLWRAWPADPTRVPMRRLSRGLAATLACPFCSRRRPSRENIRITNTSIVASLSTARAAMTRPSPILPRRSLSNPMPTTDAAATKAARACGSRPSSISARR